MPFSFVQPVMRNDYKCLNVNTAYAVCGRERFGAAVPDMRFAVVSELIVKHLSINYKKIQSLVHPS